MSFESDEEQGAELLSAAEAGDLVLAAILNGDFGIMEGDTLDTLFAEIALMDAIAIKRAGGDHLVHWHAAQAYN
jgi:hypothetical protein